MGGGGQVRKEGDGWRWGRRAGAWEQANAANPGRRVGGVHQSRAGFRFNRQTLKNKQPKLLTEVTSDPRPSLKRVSELQR